MLGARLGAVGVIAQLELDEAWKNAADTTPRYPGNSNPAKLLLSVRLKLHHSIARRNGVRPRNRNMLVEFVVGARTEIGEAGELEGYALGFEHRVAVGDLHVQVCASSVAAVAEQCKRVAGAYAVVQVDLKAAMLQVRVGNVSVGRDLEERVASETKWKVVVADDQCDSVIRVGLAVVAGALNAPRA